MTKIILTALVVLAVGCSSREEQALHIVWEEQYGMEFESRPKIEWFNGCRTDTDVDLRQTASTTFVQGCIVLIVGNDGRVQIENAEHISDSRFSRGLRQWKQWLLTSDMVPRWDSEEVNSANLALKTQGL